MTLSRGRSRLLTVLQRRGVRLHAFWTSELDSAAEHLLGESVGVDRRNHNPSPSAFRMSTDTRGLLEIATVEDFQALSALMDYGVLSHRSRGSLDSDFNSYVALGVNE